MGPWRYFCNCGSLIEGGFDGHAIVCPFCGVSVFAAGEVGILDAAINAPVVLPNTGSYVWRDVDYDVDF